MSDSDGENEGGKKKDFMYKVKAFKRRTLHAVQKVGLTLCHARGPPHTIHHSRESAPLPRIPPLKLAARETFPPRDAPIVGSSASLRIWGNNRSRPHVLRGPPSASVY